VRSAPTRRRAASRSTSSLKIYAGGRPLAALHVRGGQAGDDKLLPSRPRRRRPLSWAGLGPHPPPRGSRAWLDVTSTGRNLAFSGRMAKVASRLVTVGDDGTIGTGVALSTSTTKAFDRRTSHRKRRARRLYAGQAETRASWARAAGNGRLDRTRTSDAAHDQYFMLAGRLPGGHHQIGCRRAYAVNFGGGQCNITNGTVRFLDHEAYMI